MDKIIVITFIAFLMFFIPLAYFFCKKLLKKLMISYIEKMSKRILESENLKKASEKELNDQSSVLNQMKNFQDFNKDFKIDMEKIKNDKMSEYKDLYEKNIAKLMESCNLNAEEIKGKMNDEMFNSAMEIAKKILKKDK